MIDSIALWHRRARENPTYDDFRVQLGCHLEEMAEFLEEVAFQDVPNQEKLMWTIDLLFSMSEALKCKAAVVDINNRENFLKELCDGIVTGIGVGYCNGMAVVSAVEEVNRSNWSKFNYKGFPEFDKHGKIKKGENYSPADMKGMT